MQGRKCPRGTLLVLRCLLINHLHGHGLLDLLISKALSLPSQLQWANYSIPQPTMSPMDAKIIRNKFDSSSKICFLIILETVNSEIKRPHSFHRVEGKFLFCFFFFSSLSLFFPLALVGSQCSLMDGKITPTLTFLVTRLLSMPIL